MLSFFIYMISSIIPNQNNNNREYMPKYPTLIPEPIFKQIRNFFKCFAHKLLPSKYHHFFDDPPSSKIPHSQPSNKLIVRNTDFAFYTLLTILICAIIVVYYLIFVKWGIINKNNKQSHNN